MVNKDWALGFSKTFAKAEQLLSCKLASRNRVMMSKGPAAKDKRSKSPAACRAVIAQLVTAAC